MYICDKLIFLKGYNKMTQTTKINTYTEKQVHKISAIMDAVKDQGFKVCV